tara:strand:+ start:3647 stop:4003 length:357 start_codon:yes stop_codon:yes gene_type:complete
MSVDWNAVAAEVAQALAEVGTTATLKQVANSGTDYNPTLTPTNHACTVVTLDWKNEEIDGTLVKSTDRKILISTDGLSVVPAIGDTLTIGSDVLRLVEPFKPLSPAGTVVMYETNARA